MKRNKGHLFVISAPSGTGKTTLCNRIIKMIPNLRTSVSFTTRNPRNGEINGKDYSFTNTETFLDMVRKNDFIEWAEVYGNYYGTSRERVEEILSRGSDVVLDIDIQGAKQIKNKGTNATFIFILPPSSEKLTERLKKRNTETNEAMKKRLEMNKKEIEEYRYYCYVIVNDDLEKALRDLESIITSVRLRIEYVDPHWIENTFLK